MRDQVRSRGIRTLLFVSVLLLLASHAFGQGVPLPYEVYGTLSVDGALITGKNASYTVKLTKADGSEYIDANSQAWSQKTTGGVANNAVGALAGYSGLYAYRIPIFDASAQPGGAAPGATIYIHAYKDGAPVTITSPSPLTLTAGVPGDSLQINIVATTPRPEISITPGSLPFGDVGLGDQGDLPLNIRNIGNIDLNVSGLSFDGVGAGSYSLVTPPAMPISLPPDASTDITVRFTPVTKGSLPGTLTIVSNDPAHGSVNVPLSGNGVARLCLKNGWNLVALPVIPNSPAVGTIMNDITTKVQIVWGYFNPDGWKKHQPGRPSDLTEMRLGHGYWIKVTEDVCLTIP